MEKKVNDVEFYTWRAKEFPKVREHLRLGQAFLNHFLPSQCDPELFYEENDKVAYALITGRYIG